MIKEKTTPHIGLVTVKQSNSPTKMEKLSASTHRSK